MIRFERLIQAYLQTDPAYTDTLKYVWMWDEFPGNKDFGGKDIGVDLVALTFSGDYWAIQCKCYAETAVIDKKSVDSLLLTGATPPLTINTQNDSPKSFSLIL
ncbi:MAG: hypothetical protein ACPGRE_01355 [Flavobacteriaceae bacterium]